MKLSQKTIEVIKNFSTINQGMLFKAGSQLKTVSPQKNILAVANIEDPIANEFAIYDLNQFLSILSLSTENQFDVEENDIIINNKIDNVDGTTADISVIFRSASKNMIVSPPEKEIQFPEPEVHLSIPVNIINTVFRTASILQSPHIGISSDGVDVYLSAYDVSGAKSHMCKIKFASGNGDVYSLHFKIDSLKLFPGDYELHISSAGVSHWKNKTSDVQYWITVEPGSTYQKG